MCPGRVRLRLVRGRIGNPPLRWWREACGDGNGHGGMKHAALRPRINDTRRAGCPTPPQVHTSSTLYFASQ